jgi:autotransporter-associated beta strand protein
MKNLARTAAAGIGWLFVSATVESSHAGSATWKTDATSNDWNTAANWTPMTVPNGATDTATFQSSNVTDVSLSARVTQVNSIVFNAGASAFTIMPAANLLADLEIVGTGIVNNSGIVQNFGTTVFGAIVFRNSATAGDRTSFTNAAGFTLFLDSSNAGNSRFINNAATGPTKSLGETQFQNSSSAGNATVINSGAALADADPGQVGFFHASSAANATLIANSGQGAAMGGRILFENDSDGGTARVKVFGNGNLNIRFHNRPGVTIGSLEGDGRVFLGGNNLTIGSNDLSTNFSGVITNSGSLTKIGTAKLVLSDPNSYTGGTTVKRGRLIINNRHDSGTGSGPVRVNGGRLGGKGIIAGAVTIGSGSGREAILSPGYHHSSNPGTLTIQSPLTFNSDAAYEIEVNSTHGTADQVVAVGVTINSGAQVLFLDLGSGTLPAGTIFTVISNTSANPIAGTFSNLPDGSTFTSNGNKYKANYEGGDGNDLTLKVVP